MVVESTPFSHGLYGVGVRFFFADAVPSDTMESTSLLPDVLVLPGVFELMSQHINQALHSIQEQPWLISLLSPVLRRHMSMWIEAVPVVGSCHYQRVISSSSILIVAAMVMPVRLASCDSQLDVWMALELQRRDYMSGCLPDFVVAVLAQVQERYPDAAYLLAFSFSYALSFSFR